MVETAAAEIERRSLDAQTKLLSQSLSSEEAKALLAAMPQPEQLLPAMTSADMRRLLDSESGDCDESGKIGFRRGDT